MFACKPYKTILEYRIVKPLFIFNDFICTVYSFRTINDEYGISALLNFFNLLLQRIKTVKNVALQDRHVHRSDNERCSGIGKRFMNKQRLADKPCKKTLRLVNRIKCKHLYQMPQGSIFVGSNNMPIENDIQILSHKILTMY